MATDVNQDNLTVVPLRPNPFAILPSTLPTTVPLLTKLKDDGVYSYYGKLESNLLTLAGAAAASIAVNSDGDLASLIDALAHFLTIAREDCLADAAPSDKPHITRSCWLVVRMTKPTDEYVTPRWHQDGRMFTCSCSTTGTNGTHIPHSKYAVTLAGPATLALKSCKLIDETLAALQADNVNQYTARFDLAEKFAGCEREAVGDGEVIRFSCGEDDSPVHSEPDWAGRDRVFVSVLFGSEKEMRVMCEGWEEEYLEGP